MKKKVLLSSILTIVLCLSLIGGSTYALFTSTAGVDISVTAGQVKIDAVIDADLYTWSLTEKREDARTDGSFTNGGSAKIVDGELIIDKMTPGDNVEFTINVSNLSNVATVYKLNATSKAGSTDAEIPDLSKAIKITATVVAADGSLEKTEVYKMSYAENADGRTFETDWFEALATDGTNANGIVTITVVVEFPNGDPDFDNDFQNGKADLVFTVEAVQGNGVDENGDLILPQ